MTYYPGEYTVGAPIFKDHLLKSFIGEGGFGRVYLVESGIGKPFALKVLHKDIQTERRGVEAVRRITSNRLVNVLDYGETVNGAFCVLMEYLKDNFSGVIAEGKLPVSDACRYFLEILEGLMVLEKNGIVHRDIKPSNLFLLENIIKIGDFGTAKYTSGETTTKTRAIGTLHYCAPECFHNRYDFSVDRWSAAVIFYKMLTGRFPFEGDSYAGIIGSVMMSEPDLGQLPERFVAFFEQCFAKDADNRFGGAGEMSKAAQEALDKRIEPSNKQEKKSDKGTDRSEIQKKEDDEKRNKPKPTEGPVLLRSKPITTDSENKFQLEDIENDYLDNGDGTIIDRKTGLMWEKSGSKDWMEFGEAEKYIKGLNQKKFAGHADWRLPTVDELWSLMEKEKNGNLCIDPKFDKKQEWCWSADKRSSGSAWVVGFDTLYVSWSDLSIDYYVRAVRSGQC